MTDAGKPRLLPALFLFALWVALLVLAYWYFMIQPRHWFDATQSQPPALADRDAQAHLRRLLQMHFPELDAHSPWLVRFRQEGCGCERFVESYHASLSAQHKRNVQTVTVELNDPRFDTDTRRHLARWITASPAAAVFDGGGELAYFGPYHQDGICSAENSYLEPVLMALGQTPFQPILNTLVYGCFCPNTQRTA